MKFNYLVILKNIVTNESVIKYYINTTYEEAWKKALKDSKRKGLTYGNFEIYINCNHPDIIKIIGRKYEETTNK